MMNKPTEVAIPKEIAIGTDAIRQIINHIQKNSFRTTFLIQPIMYDIFKV